MLGEPLSPYAPLERKRANSKGFKRMQLAATAGIVLTLAALSSRSNEMTYFNPQDGLTIEPAASLGIKIESLAMTPESYAEAFDTVFNDAVKKNIANRMPAALNQETIRLDVDQDFRILMVRGQAVNPEKNIMEDYKNLIFIYNLNGINPTSDNFMFSRSEAPQKLSMTYVKAGENLFPIGSSYTEIPLSTLEISAQKLQYYFELMNMRKNPIRSQRYNVV